MADQVITAQKLIDADKDATSLDTFINGTDSATVTTRKLRTYPSLAKAVKQVMETGGFEPFATEAALLASVPALPKKAAKALDTKKVWLWDGTKWNDTGLSEFDLAKNYTNNLIYMSDVVVNNIPYLYVLADKNGRVSSGVTKDNLEMKNIRGEMKEINNNFQDAAHNCKNVMLDQSNRIVEKTSEDGKKHILSSTYNSELSHALTKADLNTFDVVIYGSGASVMTAARTAKENGLTVCLICPDYRVGGMMTAGVAVFDGATQSKSAEVGGINKVFQGHTRRLCLEISTYYGSSLLPTSFTFEPRVAQKVCNDWCNRYVDLLILDQQIHDSFTSVSVDNGRIVGIWTKQGFIKGETFIDASYTGDLLRFSGVSWTFDVEAASIAEPEAGAQMGVSFKKTNLDLTAVGLSGSAAIDALQRAEYTVVPNLTDPAIPAVGAAIPKMTIGYGTRGIVTNAVDRIPFTAYKSENYDRRNHLVYLAILLTEDFASLTTSETIVKKAIGSQGTVRSIDGERLFNTNNALFAQTSRLCKDYPVANWKRRREIEKSIIEHYLDLCYFLATDSAVPSQIRSAMTEWGHSPREWIDSPYGVGIQFKVYDRQGIRMVNDHVVTHYDFKQKYTTGHFNDPIGIFSYFFDGKKRLCYAAPATPDDKNWTLIEESRVIDSDTPLYAMPMRMLLPRKTECSNLVVAWCSAQTELAFHSCRMEATGGMQGEAAAAICVAKIKNRLRTVQDVQYSDVRQILLNQNVFLG